MSSPLPSHSGAINLFLAMVAAAKEKLAMSGRPPPSRAVLRSRFAFPSPHQGRTLGWDYVVGTEGVGLQYMAHVCIDHDARFNAWTPASALKLDHERDEAFTHIVSAHLTSVPMCRVRFYVALRMPTSSLVLEFRPLPDRLHQRQVRTHYESRRQLEDAEVSALFALLGLSQNKMH